MEINRLKKENDRLAAINAAEMAAQKAQLAAQNEKMEALQAILLANGLIRVPNQPQPATSGVNTQCTTSQARALDQAREKPLSALTQNNGVNTPSRKRHPSQQLERVAKVNESNIGNCFEVLSSADSYPDQLDIAQSTVRHERYSQQVQQAPQVHQWGDP
jgi:hypothetical protein